MKTAERNQVRERKEASTESYSGPKLTKKLRSNRTLYELSDGQRSALVMSRVLLTYTLAAASRYCRNRIGKSVLEPDLMTEIAYSTALYLPIS